MALLTTLFGKYSKQPLLSSIGPELDVGDASFNDETCAKKLRIA